MKLRRRLAPQERAGQILEFAAKLILEEGFNEVSMERLGREAGVSKALVYNYFPNQNDLLKSLLEREIEVLNKRQLEQARQAKDVPDLLLRTTRTYVEHVKERGALLQRLLSESSVARSIAIQYLEDQEQAKSYLARRVAKEYGLSDDTALTAVDMQMVLTEATARHLSRTNHDIESAVEIYVTMMIGGLEALGKSKKNQR
ncbi:MAG: TetR/AcrR family transcriptional regulator [Limnohabitans sp.]|uniref:TetR/AcrR family transcriptional regulator n=1 Tax=Limnohabitans sp. TaxID=1907725 RepID=UPI0025DB9C82|nr:TetR/AcrR family transcriptional regulator [Limnohabitans sp.]MCO4089108.1 TetR/AcrR family transcriptional regulator [Limnohabitans sp.]